MEYPTSKPEKRRNFTHVQCAEERQVAGKKSHLHKLTPEGKQRFLVHGLKNHVDIMLEPPSAYFFL